LSEAIENLTDFCQSQGIRRFSAAEMTELLEEGESVDWILEQVLPDTTQGGTAPDGAEPAESTNLRPQLRELLEVCAGQVAPPPAAEEEGESVEEGTEAGVATKPDFDFEELKGMNLPPGVDARQLRSLMESPQGALLADFGAFCEEHGIDPQSQQDAMTDQMQELHEQWLQTPRESLEGKRPVELLEGGRLLPEKVETFRREEPKVGRNDPCPCGSGKKFKKCCGRG
jgi:hypothetical protein